jgi:hypothetical protein
MNTGYRITKKESYYSIRKVFFTPLTGKVDYVASEAASSPHCESMIELSHWINEVSLSLLYPALDLDLLLPAQLMPPGIRADLPCNDRGLI